MCRPSDIGPQEQTAAATRRRKIWDIKTNCHCLICGTCLSVPELRKIAAKANVHIAPDATDYEIHGHFVECAVQPNAVAKLTQKALDRKYRTVIERCRQIKTDAELTAFWDRSLAKGDIAGPFWVVMTHPATSDALGVRVFGEVHMMSHLEGASHRTAKRRLNTLGREKQAREKALSDEAAALRRELHDADTVKRRLDLAETRLERHESGTEHQDLSARVRELEATLALRDRAVEAAEYGLSARDEEAQALRAEVDALRRSLGLIESECESLAALLQNGTGAAPEAIGENGAPFDLSGRSIVYVGGRTGLVSHFRALVERANGRFIHHDGGIEESERRLGGLLAQGDVVLCPMDCVSHRACLRAKRFCKRTARTFVPLRSSGLSSFVSGLRQVSAPPDRPAAEVRDLPQ